LIKNEVHLGSQFYVKQLYGKPSLPKAYRLVNTGPNGFQYHQNKEIVWSLLEMYEVTKLMSSVLEMYGRVLEFWKAMVEFL